MNSGTFGKFTKILISLNLKRTKIIFMRVKKAKFFKRINYQHSKLPSYQPHFAHKKTGQSDLKYWSKNKLSLTLTVGCSLEYTRAVHFYITYMGVGENVRVTRILSWPILILNTITQMVHNIENIHLFYFVRYWRVICRSSFSLSLQKAQIYPHFWL